MRKHFLAIVAIVLVLAATACTQYPDDWRDYFPNMPESNTIKTIEDLYLFLASDGDGEAEVNLTTDLSWFPITVRGNKTITGKLHVTESASSDITPPQSAVTRSASAKVLFEIEDGAAATLSNFTVSIPSEVTDKVASVVSVDAGTIKAEDFNVVVIGTATVTGITIGDNTAAANVSITNSKPGKIDIATGNKDSDDILKDITENNTDIPQEDISTRFDAATEAEFSEKLSEFGKVRLTADILISSNNLSIDNPQYNNPSGSATDPEYNPDCLDLVGNYEIDLNGYTLSSSILWELEQGTTIAISNGTFKMENPDWASLNTGSLRLYENSSLSMRNVNYSSDISGVFLIDHNSGMKLSIDNCHFDTAGSYAISTNASTPDVSQGIVVDITGSTIISKEKTGILINVPATVTISDTTITTATQALIARGGTYTITNCHLTTTGIYDTGLAYLNSDWKSGNATPYAALVIGNRTKNSYVYETTVNLDTNTTIKVADTAVDRDDIIEAYIASDNGMKVILNSENDVVNIIKDNHYYYGDTTYIGNEQLV